MAPTKKTSPKKTSPKKTSPKKTSPKKTSPKKTSPKKTSPKKTIRTNKKGGEHKFPTEEDINKFLLSGTNIANINIGTRKEPIPMTVSDYKKK